MSEEDKIINGYYQSNIKTSRNEDGVYAMRYASQQILIDKLQQENQQLKNDNAVMKAGLIEIRDKQLDLYKSVIEEVREYVLSHRYISPPSDEYYDHSKVLEILSKVNEVNNEENNN